MTRRIPPPPSHLRLVFSTNAPGGSASGAALSAGWGTAVINDLMAKMLASANQIADRAVDAMRREVTAFGLELDAETLAAIRDPILRTIAAGIRARIVGVAQKSGIDPDEDDLGDDPDDDLRPYVEDSCAGLRERLRAALAKDGGSS